MQKEKYQQPYETLHIDAYITNKFVELLTKGLIFRFNPTTIRTKKIIDTYICTWKYNEIQF